jgi:P-type Mg2+ transporter
VLCTTLGFRLNPLVPGVVGSVAAGLALVLTPLGGILGFVPLPPLFSAVLLVMVATYLGLPEIVKRRFYAAASGR